MTKTRVQVPLTFSGESTLSNLMSIPKHYSTFGAVNSDVHIARTLLCVKALRIPHRVVHFSFEISIRTRKKILAHEAIRRLLTARLVFRYYDLSRTIRSTMKNMHINAVFFEVFLTLSIFTTVGPLIRVAK